MKSNFETGSNEYAKYRPDYPIELFDFIEQQTVAKGLCWDVGTGTGQLAISLSQIFDRVIATDVSQGQLEIATKADNLEFRLENAENCSLPDHSADLVIVGQAIHWFDFDLFYQQVNRVLKPNGIILVVGYGLISVNKEVDEIISSFYHNTLGSYWDPERRYIDEMYQTIPFPYSELEVPQLSIKKQWNLEEFIGYIETWSAVKHFRIRQKENPTTRLKSNLSSLWQDSLEVRFPLLLRAGQPIPVAERLQDSK